MSFVRLAWLLVCFCLLNLANVAIAQEPKQALPAGAVARLGQTRLRHADKTNCVIFAPDGKTFISGGDDGMISVWSVATGEQVNQLLKPHSSVKAMKLTHGGQRLAVHFGSENTIRLLDALTLKELGSMPFSSGQSFAFSRDGKWMASCGLTGSTIVTEVENGLPKLELANAGIFDFHPNGKAIAIGDAEGIVTVHLVTGGKPTFTVKHHGKILGLAFSPDGTRLAIGSQASTNVLRVYEPGKEKPVAEIEGMNFPQAWLNNDTLACGNETEAGVYNLAKKQWMGRIKGMSGEFAVSPDGAKLAATGDGLRVRLWDLSNGKQLHAENDTFPNPALMVGSRDGRTLFLLINDNAYLWSIGEKNAKQVGTLPGHAVAAAVSGDKLIVATPEAVVVYDNFDPTKPLSPKPAHVFEKSAGAKAVAISAPGSKAAWVAKIDKITVANLGKEESRRELPDTSSTMTLALGFNSAGNRLCVHGRTHLRMWDVNDEVKEVWKARILRGLQGEVAFSADGKYLTVVSSAQLFVFDAADGKPSSDARTPLIQFERYTDNGLIQHAAFSPDSRTLIVGSTGIEGRVEQWELASRTLVHAFTTGYGGTSRLCIFPDGKRAASAGAEEAVTVWDLTFREGKPDPTDNELRAAVDQLSSANASVGYPALKLLVSAGNRGTGALERAMKTAIAKEKRINEWVGDLSSNTFSVRQKAMKELIAQGSAALPALNVVATSDNRDLRERAREVVEKLEANGVALRANGMTEDLLRFIRAVQALEEIGTVESQSVLKLIADISGRPSDEAKAALARLKMKANK